MVSSKKAISQLSYLKSITNINPPRLAAESWPKPWQTLIATILSSQTRDEVTIPVSERLFSVYSSPKKLSKAPINKIRTIIKPINFHKTKAKNIKSTANIISKKAIPNTLESLILLPGVGRKVANVYLSEIHKKPCIAVDTHVARISQKLRWTIHKNPHMIEKDLEKLFPKKLWNQVNPTLVRFGKTFGRSRRNEDEILDKIS